MFSFLLSACSDKAVELKTDCEINAAPCARHIERDAMKVVFDIDPRPARPMKELVFSVEVTKEGRPVTDASVYLDLSMPGMIMGENKPVLTHAGNGVYRGKGFILRCPSGGRIWQASVSIKRNYHIRLLDFRFEAAE